MRVFDPAEHKINKSFKELLHLVSQPHSLGRTKSGLRLSNSYKAVKNTVELSALENVGFESHN